ncbi:hypothetical protein ABIA35_007214 [Catenulispora sp. MAP12-49]|uniref:hypothetical protein n=1 Tax=unclassified Catenulispora TaxID=414885 RepID=UPI003514E3FC
MSDTDHEADDTDPLATRDPLLPRRVPRTAEKPGLGMHSVTPPTDQTVRHLLDVLKRLP